MRARALPTDSEQRAAAARARSRHRAPTCPAPSPAVQPGGAGQLGVRSRGEGSFGDTRRGSVIQGEGAAGFHVPSMSSYFVNPLFSKYKGGESLEPAYYDCRFPQSVGRSHALVYGPGGSAPGFQHASHHVQDFFHHGTSGISNSGYQQNPCSLSCHGDASKFYGYEALPRQSLYGAQQEASVVQYPDCKSSANTNSSEGQGHLNQNSSPSLMFPWMRPHGEKPFLFPPWSPALRGLPPSLASFLSALARFPSWLWGSLPLHSRAWVGSWEIERLGWGWSVGCLRHCACWGEGGGKVTCGCKGLKIVFSIPSVSPSSHL